MARVVGIGNVSDLITDNILLNEIFHAHKRHIRWFRLTSTNLPLTILFWHFQTSQKDQRQKDLRRTKESYVTALSYINDYLIELSGKEIIIDLPILGCWFHFCQALRRWMRSMENLYALIRKNSNAQCIFRQFQCLALLPYNQIKTAKINSTGFLLLYCQRKRKIGLHFTQSYRYNWIQIYFSKLKLNFFYKFWRWTNFYNSFWSSLFS